MLLRRVLTAVVLVLLLATALWWLDDTLLALVFALVVAAAAWEWVGLCGWRRAWPAGLYAALVGILAALLAQPPASILALPLIALSAPWLWAAGALWLATTLALPWASVPDDGRAHRSPGALLFGLLALPATVIALLWLRETDGLIGLGVLFGVVWAMDIGAYFAGRAWGRRKLAPRLSPGKTVEGLAGGLVAVVGVAVAAGALWPARFPAWPWWIGLCVVVAVVSVAGDLYESRLKRRAGVKDSGRLLPGHGGVLDRVDSLIAAAPVFVLGLELLR